MNMAPHCLATGGATETQYNHGVLFLYYIIFAREFGKIDEVKHKRWLDCEDGFKRSRAQK